MSNKRAAAVSSPLTCHSPKADSSCRTQAKEAGHTPTYAQAESNQSSDGPSSAKRRAIDTSSKTIHKDQTDTASTEGNTEDWFSRIKITNVHTIQPRRSRLVFSGRVITQLHCSKCQIRQSEIIRCDSCRRKYGPVARNQVQRKSPHPQNLPDPLSSGPRSTCKGEGSNKDNEHGRVNNRAGRREASESGSEPEGVHSPLVHTRQQQDPGSDDDLSSLHSDEKRSELGDNGSDMETTSTCSKTSSVIRGSLFSDKESNCKTGQNNATQGAAQPEPRRQQPIQLRDPMCISQWFRNLDKFVVDTHSTFIFPLS